MFASNTLHGDLSLIPEIVVRLTEWQLPSQALAISLMHALHPDPGSSPDFRCPLLVLDEFQVFDTINKVFVGQGPKVSEATAVIGALTQTPFKRVAVSGTASGVRMRVVDSVIGKTSTAEHPWTPDRRTVIALFPHISETVVTKVLGKFIKGRKAKALKRSGVVELLRGRPRFIVDFLQRVEAAASSHSAECMETMPKEKCVAKILDEAATDFKTNWLDPPVERIIRGRFQ